MDELVSTDPGYGQQDQLVSTDPNYGRSGGRGGGAGPRGSSAPATARIGGGRASGSGRSSTPAGADQLVSTDPQYVGQPPKDLKGHAKDAWNYLWGRGLLPIKEFTDPISDAIQMSANDPGVWSQAKGFIAGALKESGDIAEGLTSPGSVLLWASGVGEARAAAEGFPAVAALLKSLRIGAGAGFGIQGATAALDPTKSASDRLVGLSMAAGGAAAVGMPGRPVAGQEAPSAIPKPKGTGFGADATVAVPQHISPVGEAKPLKPLPIPQMPGSQMKIDIDAILRKRGETVPIEPFPQGPQPPRGQGSLNVPKRAAGEEAPSPEPIPSVVRPTSKASPGQQSLTPLPEGASGLPGQTPSRGVGSLRVPPRAPGEEAPADVSGLKEVVRPTSKQIPPGQKSLTPVIEVPQSASARASGRPETVPTRVTPKVEEPPMLSKPQQAMEKVRGKKAKGPQPLKPGEPLKLEGGFIGDANARNDMLIGTRKKAPKPAAPPIPSEALIPQSWQAHFNELAEDAVKQGYTGTRADLAAAYIDRLEQAKGASVDIAKAGGAVDDLSLMRTIARAGGFGIDAEGGSTGKAGMVGELESLLENLARRGVNKKTGKLLPKQFTRSGGLQYEGLSKIVNRKGGLSVDRMMEVLRDDPEFAQLGHGSMADFLETVNDSIRRLQDKASGLVPEFQGAANVVNVLENVFNVKPGARWWESGQGDPVAGLVDESVRGAISKALGPDAPEALYKSIVSSEDMQRVIDLARESAGAGESNNEISSLVESWTIGRIEDMRSQFTVAPDLMEETPDDKTDILSTGEAQARLPGDVGAVREQELAQPKLGEEPKLEMNKRLDLRHELQEDIFGGEGKTELFGGFGIVGVPKELREMLARTAVGKAGQQLREHLAASTASQRAVRTSNLLRRTFADIANAEDVRRLKGFNDFKRFGKMSTDEQVAQISHYERSGEYLNDPDYSKIYQASMEQAHSWLRQAYGDDAVGWVDNYVRRAFRYKTPGQVEQVSSVLTEKIRRSLSANKSVTRRRALNMPLDEALKTLADKGIDVDLVETNPERLRQWALNNAYRAVRYKQLGDWLKMSGLTKFVKTGADVPVGTVPLSDRRFSVYFPSDKGLVKAGAYYADPTVARLLDRAISPGLANWQIFRGVRTANNAANQLNLGLSAFHAAETALNGVTSDMARAITSLSKGEVIRGTGQALGAVAQPIRTYLKGSAFRKGVVGGDPAALEVLDSVFNPAGGRLSLESRYNTSFMENVQKALANKEYVKALGNFPPAVVQMLSKPLMEMAIPRIKVGSFLDLATDINRRMPFADHETRVKAYRLAWDSIDNRFGMLTHDNLFWNRAASDLMQLSMRSVGWNLGTLRELGGGALDVRSVQKNGLTDRLAFTVALPITVGLVNAVYQYLHTGDRPRELKDYFVPRNGKTDANGLPGRSQVKSYMSDVISFGHDPVTTVLNKRSPLLIYSLGMLTPGGGRDYYGDLIRNPDDPFGTQLEQAGKYTLETLAPFSSNMLPDPWRKAMGLRRNPSDVDQPEGLERTFGFSKAPKWLTETPLQQAAEATLRSRIGERHRTPEQVETDELKMDARNELKQGKVDSLRELLKQGVFPTQQSLRSFVKSATETPFARLWLSLPKADRARLLQQWGGSGQ